MAPRPNVRGEATGRRSLPAMAAASGVGNHLQGLCTVYAATYAAANVVEVNPERLVPLSTAKVNGFLSECLFSDARRSSISVTTRGGGPTLRSL